MFAENIIRMLSVRSNSTIEFSKILPKSETDNEKKFRLHRPTRLTMRHRITPGCCSNIRVFYWLPIKHSLLQVLL